MPEEKPRDECHREGFDQPVDEQRHDDPGWPCADVPNGCDIDLHHHRDDHEPDEDGNGHVHLTTLDQLKVTEYLHGAGDPLSQRDAHEHAQPDPDREIALEQVQPLLRDRRLRCSKCNLHSDSFFPPYPGFRARTKALMNLPSTCGATASRFSPEPASNSRASSIR